MTSALGGRRRAIVLLGAVLATTLAYRTATAASDLVYEGPFVVGGTIRLTLSPDRTGVTSFALHDVPFFQHGGCGELAATRSAYFDPPIPIVDSDFAIRVRYGSAHHPDLYEITGTITSELQMRGEARHGDFLDCQRPSDLLSWTASGPVEAVRSSSDLGYEGRASSGKVTVFTNAKRTQLTGIRFQNVQLPCVREALDIAADFDPPLELRGRDSYFRGTVPAFVGPTNFREYIRIWAAFVRADRMSGIIRGGNISTCESMDLDVRWSATLVVESEVPDLTMTPSAPAGLPNTGSLNRGSASFDWQMILSLVGCSALLMSLGVWLRRTR